jgi:hypothetical protein
MAQGIAKKRPLWPDMRRCSLQAKSWASRMLAGTIVDANITRTIDDGSLLSILPATGLWTPTSMSSAEPGLDLCSVDSTATCPSTTWCTSTTACPSTTNCQSVQTCRPKRYAADQDNKPHAAARLWPVPVS